METGARQGSLGYVGLEPVNDPRPPLSTTTSLWPAAAVLLTGAAMLVIFTLINTLGDRGVQKVQVPPTVYVVGGLIRDYANTAAHACEQNQNPPADIASSLILPEGTTQLSGPVFANQGAGDFDCRIEFSTVHSPSEVLAFYKNSIGLQGWNLFSRTSSTGKPQYLFQKAGTDGFYWILGITINSSQTQKSRWTLRIYQNSGQI